MEDASQRRAAIEAEAEKRRVEEEAEAGRPVTSGTCVGPKAKVLQKMRQKVQPSAMCCYTPPSYFKKHIDTKRADFRACYTEALKRDPSTRGRVTTKFTIEEDGSVAGVCDSGSNVVDPKLVECVLKVFTTVTFDAYSVGDPCPAVTIMYPLRFAPDPPQTPP